MVALKTVLAAVALPLVAAQANVSPLQKVVGLLQTMKSKGLDEKQKEEVQYAAYKQWCEDTMAQKAAASERAAQAASLLQADAGLAGAMSATDGQNAAQLDTAISGLTDSQKQAQAARASERGEFQKAHEAYTTTILAIDSAISALNTGAPVPTKALALISQFESTKSSMAMKAVSDFLANYESEMSLIQAPDARTGNIISLLQRLRSKFVDERNALEKEETTRQGAFALQMKGLETSVAAAKKGKSDKIQAKAADDQTKATKAGQLVNLQRTIDDTKKLVADVNATCVQNAADYALRQSLRQKELEAIDKALQLLGTVKVQAVQVATSLLNVKKVALRPEQQEVAAYLHSQAERLESSVLSALAVEATKDPFIKVRTMIQDLITRLESEAGQEAKHKDWCDAELASNQQARDGKARQVKWLTTEVDLLKSEIAKLNSDVADFTTQLAQTNQSVAQSQVVRANQQAISNQTIQDAKQAQDTIAQALELLKALYSPSLVQVGEKQPTVAKGSYGYQQDNGRAVVALLEVIKDQQAKIIAAANDQDAKAQQALDKVADQSATLIKQLSTDVQQKTTEKAVKQQLVLDKTRDLDNGQKELAAAEAYYNKLKPSCLGDPEDTAASRKTRREAEINSLQEALRMLNTAGA